MNGPPPEADEKQLSSDTMREIQQQGLNAAWDVTASSVVTRNACEGSACITPEVSGEIPDTCVVDVKIVLKFRVPLSSLCERLQPKRIGLSHRQIVLHFVRPAKKLYPLKTT